MLIPTSFPLLNTIIANNSVTIDNNKKNNTILVYNPIKGTNVLKD